MGRLLILIVLIGLASTVFGQADLTVFVLNYSTNTPLVGMEVRLENRPIGLMRTQVTNDQGRAVFRSLPEEEGYVVYTEETVDYQGARSGEISIRSNQNPTVELGVFEQRTVDIETVLVTGGPTTRINRTNAEVAFELPAQQIEQIPVEGRDITRVLYRLPNVSQATGFYPEAPNVSINGANPLFTSYLIDGLDNNERFLGGQKFAIPTGFTRNITVLTNNYSAEYGLTANGVVNVTSRSGSNEFSGEAFLITRPGPVIDGQSDFPQRDLSGNPVSGADDGFQRYQAGVAFGGALQPDKTFFFFDFESLIDLKDNLLTSPDLNVNETVRGRNAFHLFSGKIVHNWNDRFRTSLRANLGLVTIERQGGGLEGGVTFPSAGNFQDRNSALIALKNSYLGDDFSLQTNIQYARFRWNYGRATDEKAPQVTVRNPADQTIAVLGHPGYIFDQTENTLQFQQKFTYYADKHTLKAGAGIISADHQLFGGGNVNGNYLVKLTAGQLADLAGKNPGSGLDVSDLPADVEVLQYNVELQPRAYGARQTVFSVYLEDQFSLNERLNLTLGLRYDYDNLSKGGADRGDLNNLAPRFNLNYKLGKRSALRGGYGIFYDKIPYAIYSDALQQNNTSADYLSQLNELMRLGILPEDTGLGLVTFAGNLVASAANVNYLNGPTSAELSEQREMLFSNERRILNPNGYDNPYTHQLALGYQQQLNERSLFYVDLVHNQSYKLFRLRNLNAAAPHGIPPGFDPDNAMDLVRSPSEADLSRPVPIYFDPQIGNFTVIGQDTVVGVARNVVISETGGRSRYYAASFNWQKERGEDWYSFLLNYTLSFLENNTEDINFRAMDANDFDSEWGPSINDRRHIINGILNVYPSEGLTLTLAALLQSGQPVNWIPDGLLFGTTDLNGDGSSFGDAYVGNSDRWPGAGRNSGRLPWAETFDLGLQYEFSLGDGRLEFRADVFNILNTQNLSGYSNNATQSNQIQVGPPDEDRIVQKNAGAPRQFQFGLRYHW